MKNPALHTHAFIGIYSFTRVKLSNKLFLFCSNWEKQYKIINMQSGGVA